MNKPKETKVGFIKSVTYDRDNEEIRGIIETVDDKENPELPFIIPNVQQEIKKGNMVKYYKKEDSIVPSAEEVEDL